MCALAVSSAFLLEDVSNRATGTNARILLLGNISNLPLRADIPVLLLINISTKPGHHL